MEYVRLAGTLLYQLNSYFNKVVIILAVLFAISGAFIFFHAKDLPKNPTDKVNVLREQIYSTINNEELKSTPEGQTKITYLRTIYCVFLGEGCTDNPNDGEKNFNDSVFGTLTNVMFVPIAHPPASGVAWVQDGLQNAGLAPKVHAEGMGFYSISAFANIWKLFRNVTYFLMAIAIVVLGFLIMFRVQLDSQTVISVENSLPRIVITLLLITFSFAIAGFMVDLMYILLLIIFGLFGSMNIPGLQPDKMQALYLTNEIPLTDEFLHWKYLSFYTQGVRGLIEFVPDAIKAILYTIGSIYLSNVLYKVGSERFKDLFAQLKITGGIIVAEGQISVPDLLYFVITNAVLLILIPVVITYVIPLLLGILVMLFLFFRILFMLLSAYVQLVINIIFAPVLILPNVIPGNNAFMDWLKRIIGHLLTFPITITLLITVQLIAVNDNNNLGFAEGGFSMAGLSTTNPNLTQFQMPLLSLDTAYLTPIVAACFLLLIPDLVQKVVKSIAGEPLIEAGPGVLVGGVAGALGSVVGSYTGLATFAKTAGPDSPIGKALGGVLPFLDQKGQSDRKSTPTSLTAAINSGDGAPGK